MLRKQIYLDESLDRRLRKLARAQRRSAASLIRDAVRSYLERHGEASTDPIGEIVGAFEGGPSDAAREHDRYLYGRDRD
jgi:predicted transcriptional regulator